MAGTSPDFDATEFRDNIHLVMQMAAAPLTADQVTFYFPTTTSSAAPMDGEAVPFDPAAAVTRTSPTPKSDVACSIEYFDANGNPVVFGTVTPSRLAIMLLDAEYTQVKGCAYVVLGGDKYLYQRTQPVQGLFDVGIYMLHFKAEDET